MTIFGEQTLFEIWGSRVSRLIASVIVSFEDFLFFELGCWRLLRTTLCGVLRNSLRKLVEIVWRLFEVWGLRLDSSQFLWTIGFWNCLVVWGWTASRLLTQSSGSSLRICLRNYLTLLKNVWGLRFLTAARGNASVVIPLDFLQGEFLWTIGWLNLRVEFWVSQDWEFNTAGMW